MIIGEGRGSTTVVSVSPRPLIRNLLRLGIDPVHGAFEHIGDISSDEGTVARPVALAPSLIIVDLGEPRAVDFRVLRKLASTSVS